MEIRNWRTLQETTASLQDIGGHAGATGVNRKAYILLPRCAVLVWISGVGHKLTAIHGNPPVEEIRCLDQVLMRKKKFKTELLRSLLQLGASPGRVDHESIAIQID